jgi:hypothetical protein
MHDLKNVLCPRDIAQPVLTQISQADTVGEAVGDDLFGRSRNQNLTAMAGCHQAGATVKRGADVMAGDKVRLARMYGAANLHVHSCWPHLPSESDLKIDGAGHRVCRVPEDREYAISLSAGFDDLSVVAVDLRDHDPVMTPEDLFGSPRNGPPETSGTLDVGHQKGQRANGQTGSRLGSR